MAEKIIIDNQRSKKIVSMLESGDEDTITMAVKIVDNCDIEKSFPELLFIMASHQNVKYTMLTPLVTSVNFFHYVLNLEENVFIMIPVQPSLDFILKLWKGYHEINSISEDLNIKSRIIKAYQAEDTIHSFNPKLNPKKNVKRKY